MDSELHLKTDLKQEIEPYPPREVGNQSEYAILQGMRFYIPKFLLAFVSLRILRISASIAGNTHTSTAWDFLCYPPHSSSVVEGAHRFVCLYTVTTTDIKETHWRSKNCMGEGLQIKDDVLVNWGTSGITTTLVIKQNICNQSLEILPEVGYDEEGGVTQRIINEIQGDYCLIANWQILNHASSCSTLKRAIWDAIRRIPNTVYYPVKEQLFLQVLWKVNALLCWK